MLRLACGLRLASGLFLSLAFLSATAPAQTWNGGGADNNWNTAGNWTGGVPSNNGTANVFFGGTLRLAPVVNANNPWSINSLTFNFLAAANAFTISGNALTIGTGGITNNDSDFETINNNIATNGSQIWNASGNGMTFGGSVTIASGNTLTLTNGANNIAMSGAVSGGNGIIKNGSGGLFLSGTADNNGLALTANSGTVTLTKSSNASVHAIGSGGLTIAGATVQLASAFGGDQILDSAPVTLNSGITSGSTFDLEGSTETIGALNGVAGLLGGVITNFAFNTTGTLTVTGGGTYAGIIQDGSIFDHVALTVGGNGAVTLTLTGANTYTGVTTIGNTGILQLGNGTTTNGSVTSSVADNGKLLFSNPNSQTYSGAITGSGTLTKSGAGTLTLNGASTYSGSTNINGGTLLVPNGGSLTSQGTINIGNSGVAGQNGTLSVDGTGSVSQGNTAIGIEVGSVVGAANATTGTVNIGTTTNGATVMATFGMTINPTGTVNIGSGAVTGTLTSGVSSNVFINGGVLQTANAGSTFALGSSSFMQVNSGGRASFTGGYTTVLGASYQITGSGSKMETLGGGDLTVANGVFGLEVITGGLLSSTGQLFVGANNSTVTIDGSGSKLTVAGLSNVGLQGAFGQVTFSHGSTGNALNGGALVANSGINNTGGEIDVMSGSTITAMGNLVLLQPVNSGANSGQGASFLVDGTGSSVMLNPGATVSIGQDTLNQGTLTVSNNGVFTVGIGGGTTLNATGVININGGTVDLKTLTRTGSGGTVNFTSGSLSLLGSFNVGVGGLLGQNLTLDPSKILTLSGTTTIDQFKTLTLSGGTLNTGALVNNGTFVFTSGTLGITGASGLTIGSGGALGNSFTLPAGANLNVTNTTVNSGATLDVNGGNFTAGLLNNFGSLTLDAGSITINGLANKAGGLLYIGPNKVATLTNGSVNLGEIQLGGASALLTGAGQLGNAGLLHGDGVIANGVANNAGGEIRAESGKRIKLSGANGINSGTVNLQGGTAEFSQPLDIAAVGQVNGHGTLILPAGQGTGLGANQFSIFGLTDNGTIQFSGGNSDVYGSVNLPGVTNMSGTIIGPGNGKLLIGAGANTVSFYGDVWNNAALFRTATGSFAVFFGTVHGASSFSGGGTVDFEGTYLAGNSPAAVSIGGNAVFGVANTLDLDIGGTTPGNAANNYAQVNVAGSANLSGTLNLIPYNGFVPVAGDKFTVMTYASATGTFSSLAGTSPAPGLTYSAVYLPNSLVIVTTTNGDKTWGVDASGNSSLGSNWLGGVAPGGIGDSAAFTTIISANRMVTIDADTTVGTLKFDNANNYTIAGPHTLTLQAAGVTPATINVSGAHGNGAHTISAPITLASDLNITQNSGGTFTLSGALNDAAGKNITTSGSGVTAMTGSVNFGNSTTLTVNSGTLRFGLTTGAAAIGAGVQATVNSSATLELAGTVSALASGAHRVNIVNSSAANGVLVSGTNQVVGNIDGSGTTQVNAGSDLTANHIIQSALIIGGTMNSAGLVTIDASDASGNPLGQSSGFAVAGSLQPKVPLAAGAPGSSSLDPPSAEGFSGDPIPASPLVDGGNPSAVPEPTTLLLFALGGLGCLATALRRRAYGR